MHAIHRFLDRITCDRIIEQSFSTAILQNPDQNALWARQTCKIVWHPHLPAMRSSRRNSAAGVPPQNRPRAVRQAEYDALSASSKSAFHYTDDLIWKSLFPVRPPARPPARPPTRPPARTQ